MIRTRLLILVSFIFAVTSFSARAELGEEAKNLLLTVIAEHPPGVLGLRLSKKGFDLHIFNKSKYVPDAKQARHLCEQYLTDMLGPKASSDLPLFELMNRVSELFDEYRLRGPLPAAERLRDWPPAKRASILREILSHPEESAEWVRKHSVHLTLSEVVTELIAPPFEEVQKLLPREEKILSQHWSGEYGGAEINSNIQDLVLIQNTLGAMSGSMVDVGSGFGIPGLVFGLLNPNLKYLGLEIAGPKVRAAQQLAVEFALPKVRNRKQDLSAPGFLLPEADYYYFYNPVSPELTDQLLLQINAIGARRPVTVILNGTWGHSTWLTNFDEIADLDAKGRHVISILRSRILPSPEADGAPP